MQRSELLDLYFIEARSKLIDVAAFLDRIERASPDAADDYRLAAFRKALKGVAEGDFHTPGEARRAEKVLLALSDPTTVPVEHAGSKAAATGAWPGEI